MSLQTCWGLFFELRPIFGFFFFFFFLRFSISPVSRLKLAVSQGKIDRPKKLLRVTKKSDSIENLTFNFYKKKRHIKSYLRQISGSEV